MTPTPSAARAALPFTALVDQAPLQRALLLAAVDPAIGGVLICGPRGTAKSTAARALAGLLPQAPFVTLPLAASLEQLVGTLNVEDALRDGQVRLAPGLLARAHQGVLYVDEVNLLPDALVDALLDAAASGVNTVERDGISQQHAARFVLVGTMNPEEGELRPQLLDRFGLSLTLDNPREPARRQAILRSRLAFDHDPQAVVAQHAPALAALSAQVARARADLAQLEWTDAVLEQAAQLALAAGVDGVRADLVMLRAARALAALEGRHSVSVHDVQAVADLALAHRRTETASTPLPTPPSQPSGGGAASGRPSEGPIGGEPPLSGTESGPLPDGDWGALPPQATGMTRVTAVRGWPAKKA